MRLLYLFPGLVPPVQDPARDRFHHLSQIASGVALLPVWWASAAQASEFLRPQFPEHRVGNFRYRFHLAYRRPKFLRGLSRFAFYVRRGRQEHRRKPFDVIVTYGTNSTGVAAVLLKWLTGARLVVELPGVPENAFRFDKPQPGVRGALRHFLANRLLLFVGRRADCLKLLYPAQVDRYPALRRKPAVVVHDFVPIAQISETMAAAEKYVLSIGHPWFTKGMDVLIEAFRTLAPDYPDWRLRLMGHFPDREHLEKLAGGCAAIEFLAPRPHPQAMQVLGACTIFALASRTEAAPRVVLEAMAARKPVIAASVGGIPYHVQDGQHALLFPSGDAAALATRLTRLLNDAALRNQIGTAAQRRVRSEFDEQAYVRGFARMFGLLDKGDRRHVSADEEGVRR